MAVVIETHIQKAADVLQDGPGWAQGSQDGEGGGEAVAGILTPKLSPGAAKGLARWAAEDKVDVGERVNHSRSVANIAEDAGDPGGCGRGVGVGVHLHTANDVDADHAGAEVEASSASEQAQSYHSHPPLRQRKRPTCSQGAYREVDSEVIPDIYVVVGVMKCYRDGDGGALGGALAPSISPISRL